MVISNLKEKNEVKEFLKLVKSLSLAVEKLEKDLQVWVLENFKKTNVVDPNSETIKEQLEECGYPQWIADDILKKTKVDHPRFISFLCDLIKRKSGPEIIKGMFDLSWDVEKAQLVVEDIVLDFYEIEECPEEVKEHVLNKYLPRKIMNMLGIKIVEDSSVVNIERNYRPDEGKILGLYEQFVKFDINDLRIDLQPALNTGYTSHNGSPEYALLLVQYGLKLNKKKPFGDYAGILVPKDHAVTYKEVRDAMKSSFETRRIVRIAKRYQVSSDFQIFCDLDDVLADFSRGVFEVTGRTTESQSSTKMWSRILSRNGFFRNLHWMEDGKRLWSFLSKLKYGVTNFDRLSQSTTKHVTKDKQEWCNEKLGKDVNVITCMSKDKYRYATLGSILIDDNYDNGKQWENHGGVFILHSSAER
eukprot:TRINITY_DN2401_c0_g1_i6.p1 TRINITY_DN2401_c0_g1~~TRINITY_DN2401_c0_g1_i6.p1  ORF type:complete len:416 (-),score=105.40 TRINITY_DN2401_c0_g1_i6:34-1281(-)